tara:strand:- start:1434 stop:1580 length:147 start_codon:yes stop_codon:yes gene_type:complete
MDPPYNKDDTPLQNNIPVVSDTNLVGVMVILYLLQLLYMHMIDVQTEC